MPGLLRGVARTAVVAGTATAVSNRVSRRQANRWSQQEEQQYAQQQQQYQAPPPPPAPAAAPTDTITQLKELAELKAQGILTDASSRRRRQRSWQRNARSHARCSSSIDLGRRGCRIAYLARRRNNARNTREMQEKFDATHRVASPVPKDAGSEDQAIEKLKELATLHTSGALTDEEFTLAKAKLLDIDAPPS